jgi:hypothetical protein
MFVHLQSCPSDAVERKPLPLLWQSLEVIHMSLQFSWALC